MQMDLNPTRCAGHILAVVLCSPALKHMKMHDLSSCCLILYVLIEKVCVFLCPGYLNEAHADGTHLGELVDGLEPMVDRLSQQLCKLLVVENLQAAATGDLTHSCRVEAVVVVTVTALDEDTAVTQTFRIHLPANIIQMDTWEETAEDKV